MKDIETIKAYLDHLCEVIDNRHKLGLATNTDRIYLDGACDLAKALGYTTNYDPLTNTFTVSKEN